MHPDRRRHTRDDCLQHGGHLFYRADRESGQDCGHLPLHAVFHYLVRRGDLVRERRVHLHFHGARAQGL